VFLWLRVATGRPLLDEIENILLAIPDEPSAANPSERVSLGAAPYSQCGSGYAEDFGHLVWG
jgi:hypothetical protein